MTECCVPNISGAEILPLLRRALDRARLDFVETVEKAKRGEVQFHEVPGAVGITSVGVSGAYRTCYCLAVAGDRSGLTALEKVIDGFARRNNCQVIEADGRLGWQRIHRQLANGYEVSAVKFRKSLE